MKLTLLPLQKDDLIRARCDGPVSRRDQEDPLLALLGPHCYGHTVLLSLERSQSIDTSGISWLIQSHEQFSQAGGKLILHGVSGGIIDVLNFLCLTPQLVIAANEKAACEQILHPDGAPSATEGSGNSALRFPR